MGTNLRLESRDGYFSMLSVGAVDDRRAPEFSRTERRHTAINFRRNDEKHTVEASARMNCYAYGIGNAYKFLTEKLCQASS